MSNAKVRYDCAIAYRPLPILGQGRVSRSFLAIDENPACMIKQVWPSQVPDPDKIVELFHQQIDQKMVSARK